MGEIFRMLVYQPLGMILNWMYSLTGSYGFAIVLFTIAVKVLLLPLSVKQQKAMVDMQKVQPLINDVQTKYKNDKEKLNKEMMKIYSEHKVNPMGGCLPLIIQLPIMFGLYRVIYQPLTYIKNLTMEEITNLAGNVALSPDKQIDIAKQCDILNFSFLGLDLSATPSFSHPSFLWIIPILSGLSAYLSSKVTTASSASSKNNSQAAGSMNSMMTVMPFMSAFICFTLPSGVGLYWVVSNLVQIVQQVALSKYFDRFKKGENGIEKNS